MKLFAMRMMANNSLGFSNRLKAVWGERPLRLLKSSFSLGEREKKATSDPETRADAINNKSKMIEEKTTGNKAVSHWILKKVKELKFSIQSI